MLKEYINGLGIDNVIAFDSEENGLSNVEKEELSFCENTVLSQTGSFAKYGWNDIVNRCDSLSNSGSLVGTNRYYLHKNHLGSIVGITNNSGTLVTEYDYDVFGKASIVGGSDIGNTILFTGREYDKEIGLYYFRARYYDAELGRFINRDPIGQVDDVNLYTYVNNNPINYVDPNGLNSKPIVEAIRFARTENTIIGLVAIPFVFFPPTTAPALVALTTTGIAGVALGGTETYLTGDPMPVAIELASFILSKAGGRILKGIGVLPKVSYNTQAMRFMGYYATGSFGFVASNVGSIAVGVGEVSEAVIGYSAGKITEYTVNSGISMSKISEYVNNNY